MLAVLEVKSCNFFLANDLCCRWKSDHILITFKDQFLLIAPESKICKTVSVC